METEIREQNSSKDEESKVQNEKNIISLENCDYKSKTNRITSPRSLKAIESLGVNKKDLYQISFEKFKSQNLDVQELPKELQKYRYNSLENFRNKTINQVKEKRQNLIEEEENNNINNKYNYNEKDNKNKRKLDPKMEKLLEEQKATIQKIKNKQKYDIEQIIEAQLQKEIDLKNTAEKEREKKEKEKEAAIALKKKRIIEQKEKEEKERRIQEGINKRIREQEELIKLKEEKEKKKIKRIERIRKKKIRRKRKKK